MNTDKTLKKFLNNNNISYYEAYNSMLEIMKGEVSNIKFSSWLTALKIKSPTIDEISGFASAMQDLSKRINLKDSNAIDIVGTGGDNSNSINISTASAIVASAAGVTVAKHGNKSVSSKSGSADVLTELKIKFKITPAQMEECLDKIGLAFLYAPLLHPAMKNAAPVRKELSTRTVFNILGPLCNPARVKNAVIGVYSRSLCKKVAKVAQNLNFNHVIVVYGNGMDEISLTGTNYICELKNTYISEYELNPKNLGFNLSYIEEIQGNTPGYNANILEKILDNSITGPRKEIVILNSAAGLLVAGKANNWKEAIEIATSTLESGKAGNKLKALVNQTQKY